jgi:ubiquinone/menaquinone biosynthesis C-methylase UbiE
MNIYSVISKAYDLLDVIYFSEKGKNPREVIMDMIPDKKVYVLDMCCGTLSNTIAIAEKKPDIKVVGLDLSKDMLRIAKKKINKKHLENVKLKCASATETGMLDNTFDYIIIGLVLHESSPTLIDGILKEAYRLLKDDGKLIILEWEQQNRLWQIVKFAPLYWLERINCKTFKQFYEVDKKKFFKKYRFRVKDEVHCNYSVVMALDKMEESVCVE